MRYVLDCSVALQWFLPEALADNALYVLDRARRGDIALVAPDIFFAEFGHGLRKHALGKRIEGHDALQIWKHLVASGLPEVVPAMPLGEDALSLALRHHATFYDALYLALAIREDVQLLTADDRMVNAFGTLNRTLRLADLAPTGL